MPPTTSSKLAGIVALLRARYGRPEPPPASSAFEHVLLEKVAYLTNDVRRARAFDALRARVGATPQAIRDADPGLLLEIASMAGRIAAVERVRYMQDAAVMAIDEFNGSLDRAAELPLHEARRVFQRVHGIGEPGADRILLLVRAHRLLPVDSNGLRTLVRLGYGRAHGNYSTMYKSVREAIATEIVPDFDWLIEAHLLLRRHGQDVCKRTEPQCNMCELRALCDFASG